MSWLKGPELAKEGQNWCAGTTEWPVRSVLLSPGSGKVWFYPSTTGRRGLCPRAGAQHSRRAGKVGRSEPDWPDPPKWRPLRPGSVGAGPQPGFGRGSQLPHLTLQAGFQKRSRKGSGYCRLREDYFQFSQGKKAFAGVALA